MVVIAIVVSGYYMVLARRCRSVFQCNMLFPAKRIHVAKPRRCCILCLSVVLSFLGLSLDFLWTSWIFPMFVQHVSFYESLPFRW